MKATGNLKQFLSTFAIFWFETCIDITQKRMEKCNEFGN